MIVRDQPSPITLFFVMQGSVVPQIISKIAAVASLSVLVLIIDHHVLALPRIALSSMGVFGIALSLFLGFRNNAAYERWWEARKLWGGLIADVRNLARITALFVSDLNDKRELLSYAVVFAHLNRQSLRDSSSPLEIYDWVSEEIATDLVEKKNGADAALQLIAQKLSRMRSSESISEVSLLAFTNSISALGQAQAGCERIATTPLPFVYSLLVRRTTYIYCLLLPFALLDTAGVLAPLFTAIVAYVFFGLQAVANELEHPFRQVENGLPLDALCRIVEISIAEDLGLRVPVPLVPSNHVLS